ncbi:pentapeptide repeat-containing protein [Streptosporangium sp. NPDC087985]|uniref:pentapeptide repeat-containing protein n=1 Tax=Streptosporangium sp. NPDC087985 TaxID=3366196 RepID=UPI00381B9016
MRRSVSLALVTAVSALSAAMSSPAQAAAWPCRPGQGPDLRGGDFSGGFPLPGSLRCADLTAARLSGVDLRQRDLTGAVLLGADLRQANLTQATLHYADLRGADLGGANLVQTHAAHADLRGAFLSGAEARQAEFPHADLTGAMLTGAELNQADFTGALVEGTSFAQADGADLTGSRGTPTGVDRPARTSRGPGFRTPAKEAGPEDTRLGARPEETGPEDIRPGARAKEAGPRDTEPTGTGRAPSAGLVLVVFSAAGLALTMTVWGIATRRRSRRNAP